MQLVVSIYDFSLFITSCDVKGLLTAFSGQRDRCRFPSWCATHDEQTLPLQSTEAVTDIALGTRQRRNQRWVTTRDHPTGPLLIGRQPAQDTLLEAGETHGSHH
jgi:hypothetical protein